MAYSMRGLNRRSAFRESTPHHDACDNNDLAGGVGGEGEPLDAAFPGEYGIGNQTGVVTLFFLGRRLLKSHRFRLTKRDLYGAMRDLPHLVNESAQHA